MTAASGRIALLGQIAVVLATAAMPAVSAEFRSTAGPATVFYDAPSSKARPLFVVARAYPVEVMVSLSGWIKVRDADGSIVWVEERALTSNRMVVVKSRVVEVRAAPDDFATVAFKVAQGVLLELVEVMSSGWVRVRHAEGGTGFVRTADIWGT
jgi:SH3-like domain-containing protein